MKQETQQPAGRFAPSPTGRMHLGNIFAAMISLLSAKSKGGQWILRIEDLDPQRSRKEYALQIEDDLQWLGMTPDKGGVQETPEGESYCQSQRTEIYQQMLCKISKTGYTYPCSCTRADIRATQAPHSSDGRIIYSGKCRPKDLPNNNIPITSHYATRIFVPDKEIIFNDLNYGPQKINPAQECGDFVLRRADGAWAYQFAVVVDDHLMGVTEIVRGQDLLSSAAQQIYLYNLLGFPVPQFFHIPLICNTDGIRLSKRDSSLSMETLRRKYTPQQIIGYLAHLSGLRPTPEPATIAELIPEFSPEKLSKEKTLIATPEFTVPKHI